ncbi:transposase [Microtetraspora sp. AC03309]|nr:transposase [Microtetraspora sp. AC03309]
MIDLAGLVRGFADLLRPREGNADRLDAWIATAKAADLPHPRTFTRGLDQDRDAVRAAVTSPFHNGGTEGVNTKTKRIPGTVVPVSGRAVLSMAGQVSLFKDTAVTRANDTMAARRS